MKKKTILLLCLTVLIGIGNWLSAGDLEPPAPPAPTMKTLNEVEPRIPINAENTPGDASNEYIISNSGSYYLTGNVTTSKVGIRVNADDVTIDLMGYTIVGSDGNANGISINQHNNIKILNGTIRDFHIGIYAISSGQDNQVIGVRAISNVRSGIDLRSKSSVVKDCEASGNGTASTYEVNGIYVGSGCSVINNRVYDNGVGNQTEGGNGVHGISARDGSTVVGNTVYGNGTSADDKVRGIYAAAGSTVSGNTVYDNGGSTTGGNDVHGIFVPWGCTVTGNTSYSNGTSASGSVYGFFFGNTCLVDQNTAYLNGQGAGSATNMTLGVAGCVYGNNVAP